jgi:hypothetical protein
MRKILDIGKFQIYTSQTRNAAVQLTTVNTDTGCILNLDQLAAQDLDYLIEVTKTCSERFRTDTSSYIRLLQYKLQEAFKSRTNSYSVTFVQTEDNVWQVKQGEEVRDITILDCALFIKQQLEPSYPPSLAKFIYAHLSHFCLDDDGMEYDDIYFTSLVKHSKLSVLSVVINNCDSKSTIEFAIGGFDGIFKYESRIAADGALKVSYKYNNNMINKPSKITLELFRRVADLHLQTVGFIDSSLKGKANEKHDDKSFPDTTRNPFLNPVTGLQYGPPLTFMYPDGCPQPVFGTPSFADGVSSRRFSPYMSIPPEAY